MKKAGGELPVIPERAFDDRTECRLVPSPGRPVLGAEISRAIQRQRDDPVRVDDRYDLPRSTHLVRPERDQSRCSASGASEVSLRRPPCATRGRRRPRSSCGSRRTGRRRSAPLGQRDLRLDIRGLHVERSAGQDSAKKRLVPGRAQAQVGRCRSARGSCKTARQPLRASSSREPCVAGHPRLPVEVQALNPEVSSLLRTEPARVVRRVRPTFWKPIDVPKASCAAVTAFSSARCPKAGPGYRKTRDRATTQQGRLSSTPGNCITCRLMPRYLVYSIARHACLPTRTCSFPTCQDVGRRRIVISFRGLAETGRPPLFIWRQPAFRSARCALVRGH